MDFSSMMKGMQKKMLDMQKAEEHKRAKMEIIGESGGGIVKVVMNGNYDVTELYISDALKENDEEDDEDSWEVLSDLVLAALKNAKKQVDEKNSDSESSMMNNMGLPFKMPF